MPYSLHFKKYCFLWHIFVLNKLHLRLKAIFHINTYTIRLAEGQKTLLETTTIAYSTNPLHFDANTHGDRMIGPFISPSVSYNNYRESFVMFLVLRNTTLHNHYVVCLSINIVHLDQSLSHLYIKFNSKEMTLFIGFLQLTRVMLILILTLQWLEIDKNDQDI